MKFLGISYRNHDANIAFSDGVKIKYLKLDEELINENIKEINELDYIKENPINILGLLESKGISSGKNLNFKIFS